MLSKLSLASVLAVLLAGCAAVPKTNIIFDPTSHALRIQSPKNVTIESAEVSQDANGFKLLVKGYVSTNDVSAITAIAQANAATAAAVSDASKAALGAAIQAAK